jgi:hypothetical protein
MLIWESRQHTLAGPELVAGMSCCEYGLCERKGRSFLRTRIGIVVTLVNSR